MMLIESRSLLVAVTNESFPRFLRGNAKDFAATEK
jgi:hypothetical protein